MSALTRSTFSGVTCDLIVEIDGFAIAPRPRRRSRRTAQRDAELQALGYRVLRVTYRQLVQEPAGVTTPIRELLARARGSR